MIHCDNAVDFRTVYDAHIDILLKVVTRITNDTEAAEDLVHDSLIKAHEKKMCFPTLEEAKYWLLRVSRNAALNYVKRCATEKKAYKKVYYEDNRKQAIAEDELVKAQDVQNVSKMLDKIGAKYKEVLVLKEYGNLSYKEIGKMLGISETNVKVRVFRARQQLERLLLPYTK